VTAPPLVLGSVRTEIAGYLSTVLWVYTLIILVYLLSTLYFSFGGRVPYSRAFGAAIGFVRDVSEPFLSIFRRVIPPLGPLDLSPILAILVLRIVGALVVDLIHG
jgi:YggT family protein